jgi:hypothetical protein
MYGPVDILDKFLHLHWQPFKRKMFIAIKRLDFRVLDVGPHCLICLLHSKHSLHRPCLSFI